MAAPVAAQTNPLLRPSPVGMPLAVGSTRLHGHRACVQGPRPPPRLPAYLGPEPGSARQHALPEGGGDGGSVLAVFVPSVATRYLPAEMAS